MDNLFNDLLNDIKKYLHNEDDINFITRAYYYAKEKHDGVFRKDGLPYISHPIEVTAILSKLTVGPNTLVAGLLHDVVEDTDTSVEDIKEAFNEDVSILVDGLTKVSKLKFSSLEKHQVENHQKMLLAMGKDIRVIVIKLADRLHNMRTMEFMPEDKRKRISMETLEIYAPLAHKLGMFRIKNELEDKSLKYIEPVIYNKINDLTTKDQAFNSSVDEMINKIDFYLKESHVKDYQIKGRVKNSYSIYKKMSTQEKSYEDIYDVLAIRVIVDEVGTCYQSLGLIHAHFTPVPKRFKDYIAVPKQNMYQSLHTTVIGVNGQTFEIQIRTKEMDSVAEYGIAAHWGYKENVTYSKEKEQYEIAKKLKWYAELLQLTAEDRESSDFVESVKGDILDANIYVYTPKGEVIALSKGATPLDFAYKIHTDLGHKTTGAIVNNKIVPLTYEMQNGDLINLKTSNNSKPTDSWLKIVKTNYAKHKIKTYLNKQNKDILIQQGKSELEREIQANARDHEELNDAFVLKYFSKNNIKNLEELYFEIGKGTLSVKTVEFKLSGTIVDKELILQRQIEKSNRILTTNSDTGVVVEGLTNPQIKLGACCNPVPDDKIVGYVSKGQGLIVHRLECSNLLQLEGNRLLELQWATHINRKYPVKIKISSILSNNILTNVISTVNACGVNIANINATNNNKFETIIKLKLLVSSLTELNLLLVNIRKISDITNIERI